MNEIINKKGLLERFRETLHIRTILSSLAVFLIVLASLITVTDGLTWLLSPSSQDEVIDDASGADCNVSGLELHGSMVTYIPASDYNSDNTLIVDETASQEIVYKIGQADQDDNIKAIILEVDSYGGVPVAGEEIAKALKGATKPTVALIRSSGLSAAYMAASGADQIFASVYSDVGSIGVTMSYLENVLQNQKEGLIYIPLSSGKFKDTGSPDKSLTQEEKNLFMRDIKISYQNFIKLVAENRNLSIEKVTKLSDGSTMLGEMALQNGLIDQIGGIDEVMGYLEEKIGEDVEICW